VELFQAAELAEQVLIPEEQGSTAWVLAWEARDLPAVVSELHPEQAPPCASCYYSEH